MRDYYKISDVAKIIGISSGLVRHYERLGIIKPKRSKNGYRNYTTRDINILTGTRRYIGMGFSLESTDFLINEASLNDVINSLEDMEESLKKEIRWKQLILNEIQQSKEKYKLINKHDCKFPEFSIENSPPVYRINCQNNMTITIEEAVASNMEKWIEKMPVVRVSPEFPVESICNMADDYYFGFLVDESLAEELELINMPGIKFYPSRLCLTTIIKSVGDDHIKPSSLKDAVKYMNNHNMKMTDNAWGDTIGNYTVNGEHHRYHLIYIPIECKD